MEKYILKLFNEFIFKFLNNALYSYLDINKQLTMSKSKTIVKTFPILLFLYSIILIGSVRKVIGYGAQL